ncbi:MAG TPA: M20 family metallopeptidase [Gemmatimonadota bacterium]|nr:M20 family metallopeptidase [Gemmatimonadota bacterium]
MKESARRRAADRAAPEGSRPIPEDFLGRLVAVRRELHRHPETSWNETGTAERIENWLLDLGLEPRRVCGTGVLVDVPGGREGARVALRADIDALPITEETGLPFASQNPGAMHACGHDGHIAMLLGAAELLARNPPPGPVRLIFQPAEEVGTGAKALIEAGALDGVTAIFGGHLDIHFPAGTIFVTPGPVAASTDLLRVRIAGRGGHAARPHETVDAVVVASHVVLALQHIVSRGIDPAEAAVVTVGRLQAGEVANAIAGSAILEGTIRAFKADVRERLLAETERIARATAALHGAVAEVEIAHGTPPVVNEERVTALAREAALKVAGPERVVPLLGANMAGEDFSFYQDRVPGCYVRYGARPILGEAHPNHSSRFDFDEAALGWGAAWLAEVARVAGRDLEGVPG